MNPFLKRSLHARPDPRKLRAHVPRPLEHDNPEESSRKIYVPEESPDDDTDVEKHPDLDPAEVVPDQERVTEQDEPI
jgi:hypothetical protein